MRILFLTGQVPYPPHAGGAMRVFGLLDGLRAHGHTLDLMTFSDNPQIDIKSTPLGQICKDIIALSTPHRTTSTRLKDLILSGRADMERRNYSPQFEAQLKTQLSIQKYDLVHIESLEMAPYITVIKTQQPRLPVIYDSFNAEYDLQRLMFEIDRRDPSKLLVAFYSFIQWQRLAHFEREVCRTVDYVIAVSEADAEAFRKLLPGVKVAVVHNGIYTEEYIRPAQSIAPHTAPQIELGGAPLLFTGSMNYRPNVDAVQWFADNVLGEVRKIVPEARLFVVGNNPHPRLDALRQRPDVEVTGYVQDVLPFLHGAAVYVAPLRMGSGTRLKLLQAMAAGCAIVSTSIGAQGLAVESGRDMMIANDALTFAQNTITLLREPELRERLTQSAYKLVSSQYDWSAILPNLLKVYGEMGLGKS
jgi:glycosyltransferase involved in cell wall biosynthesis